MLLIAVSGLFLTDSRPRTQNESADLKENPEKVSI